MVLDLLGQLRVSLLLGEPLLLLKLLEEAHYKLLLSCVMLACS